MANPMNNAKTSCAQTFIRAGRMMKLQWSFTNPSCAIAVAMRKVKGVNGFPGPSDRYSQTWAVIDLDPPVKHALTEWAATHSVSANTAANILLATALNLESASTDSKPEN